MGLMDTFSELHFLWVKPSVTRIVAFLSSVGLKSVRIVCFCFCVRVSFSFSLLLFILSLSLSHDWEESVLILCQRRGGKENEAFLERRGRDLITEMGCISLLWRNIMFFYNFAEEKIWCLIWRQWRAPRRRNTGGWATGR